MVVAGAHLNQVLLVVLVAVQVLTHKSMLVAQEPQDKDIKAETVLHHLVLSTMVLAEVVVPVLQEATLLTTELLVLAEMA